MKNKRLPLVLLLVHPHYRPDQIRAGESTERDVWQALKRLGYRAEFETVDQNLEPFTRRVALDRPHVVFNLLEEVRGEGIFDYVPVSWLEAHGIAFTGADPRVLALTRNKLWSLRLARSFGHPVPEGALCRSSLKGVTYPAFLKFSREHASLGITGENVVRTPLGLERTMARMRKVGAGEIMWQEFIPGREVSVSVLGNRRARSFPPWMLTLPNGQAVATEKVKFDAHYRHRQGIRSVRYPTSLASKQLESRSKRLFEQLEMSGYARFDYRINAKDEAYLIDVNANPSLARVDEFAQSARADGLDYEGLIEQILDLGRKYRPRV